MQDVRFHAYREERAGEQVAVRVEALAVEDVLPWGKVTALLLRLTALLIFLMGAALLFGSDTAMFRGNAAHTGAYDAAGVAQLKGVKWTFHAGGQVIASPAVDGDVIYAATTAGKVYAV